MAYDEQLAERVRAVLAGQSELTERKMFGGLAFMLAGNMCVGVEHDRLMVRLGQDLYEDALTRPHAAPMDFTGRPMKGFVFVAPGGISTPAALLEWVDLGVQYCRTLPAKKAKTKSAKKSQERRW